MKTLRSSTDFSSTAENARKYGLSLRKSIEAEVVLSNAIIIPVEISQASIFMRPILALSSKLRSIRRTFLIDIWVVLTCSTFFTAARAADRVAHLQRIQNDPIASTIRNQIIKQNKNLYYPLSVQRFYAHTDFKLVWVAPDTVKTHAYEAMLLLDCVLQYGLSHGDYHPDKLLYDQLNGMSQHFNQFSNDQKVVFDIFLTDAMLRFTNNLHYGKLNPKYSNTSLDLDMGDGLQADKILWQAIQHNDFIKVVELVQPHSDDYTALQREMHLLAGVHVGDCYDTPQATIRQIAINMERLRWAGVNGQKYIQINIPSFNLKLHGQDTDLFFKVAVGKAKTPTPRFQSFISGFFIGTNLHYPQQGMPTSLKDAAHQHQNAYQIYDHDGRYLEPSPANIEMAKQNPAKYIIQKPFYPQNHDEKVAFNFSDNPGIFIVSEKNKQLFKSSKRDITGGSVKVHALKELVADLLKTDGGAAKVIEFNKAISDKQNKEFILKTKLPVYITYLTCQMKNGLLETYADVYSLDSKVDKALFNSELLTPYYQ